MPGIPRFTGRASSCYAQISMSDDLSLAAKASKTDDLWCPTCARVVDDPLVCGDCSAVICRVCGTPLESADELAFG
jgi:hypothetical protein